MPSERKAKTRRGIPFIEGPHADARPVIGLAGGLHPSGLLLVQFFMDLPRHPSSPEAALAVPLEGEVTLSLVRQVQATITVPGPQIRGIAEWFTHQADAWDAARGASDDEETGANGE